MGRIFLGVISVLALAVGLPIMVTNLITAQNTSGAPTDFTNALAISFILLGLAPAGVIFATFIRNKFVDNQ